MFVWLPDCEQLPEKQILKIIVFFDKMVSILINVMQHEQYFFSFWHTFLMSACATQSYATSCMSLMSHHQVNNKCNRVKRMTLKMTNLCPT